jgi:superfamily I DNA and/or RNA helicase
MRTVLHHRLFEHFYSDGGVYEGVGIPLRTQYRMHRDIAYYPNRRFYDNILESGRSITPVSNHPTLIGYDIGGSESAVRSSTANTTEARLVAYLVGDFLDTESISAEDIGVITPYTAQKYEIKDMLPNAADAVTVDTIDAFQGSEKPVVFISLVRSNGDGHIGFLGRPEDGPRRLNVALTRAQRFCAVIGDWQTLTRERDDDVRCTDLYRSLRSHLDDTGRFRHVEPEFIT